MKVPGQKVAILGLGVSGYESARFLFDRGFHLFVSDQSQTPLLQDRAQGLRQKGIEVETGRHSLDRILRSDWALISPGIAPSSSVYQAICEKGLPVFSEIEAASWFCPSPKIIAVTGSAGKTTVTTLLAQATQKAFGASFLCGNIGNPWIGELHKISKEDFVVLEVSSFQLMHCESFRPQVGVLLNLSPNHQDWHRDMREYAGAKLRIFRNQTENDFAVLRFKDQECFFPEFQGGGKAVYFDKETDKNPNEAAVFCVARLLGIEDSIVESVLRNFEGIEHRLEKVASSKGVNYINDSKCTTPASLAWALQKFPDGSVILLAGGHPKSNDFDTVKDLVHKKVKLALLLGEARLLLRRAWQKVCDWDEAESFQEAVYKAHSAARGGDTVLLSPACASFDMFKNYQERGAVFKKLVLELTERKGERKNDKGKMTVKN